MGPSYPAKPLVQLAGRPLVGYPLAALLEAGAAEVLAVGGDATTEAVFRELGLEVVSDPAQGQGPLAGILQAMERAVHGLVVVLACDTPLVGSDTVERLVHAAEGFEGAVAQVGDLVEPLIAAYRPETVAVFEAAAHRGGAVNIALPDLRLARLEIDPVVAMNINTPADLERASALLKRRSTSPEGDGR
jgi:molybdenum cofactor guanylyltransferase